MSEERPSSTEYTMKDWEIAPACELGLEVTGNRCHSGMLEKKTLKTQWQQPGWDMQKRAKADGARPARQS